MALQILPDFILKKQVCQECFQYLSVPPIVLNIRGESICGRCVEDHQEKYTISLFNSIAERFKFKCSNHFDGCLETLGFNEVKKHEETCFYEPQHCCFCSYSGNFLQILNHSVKTHPGHVSFDGIIPFSLSSPLKKTLLIAVKENIVHVTAEMTEDVFRIVLKLLTKKVHSNLNQYVVKFFNPKDSSDEQVHSDYDLLNPNMENKLEKPKELLASYFGYVAMLHCQVSVDTFSMEEKELDFQKRIVAVRKSEEDVNNLKRDLTRYCENYQSAMNVIKKMSFNLFRCCGCHKNTIGETYFCPKVHCYCKDCLSSFCKLCNTVREFKRLCDLENFLVSCDWPGCGLKLGIKNYLMHKSKCSYRRYKCPLQNCDEVVLSSQNFVKHWHSDLPALIVNSAIYCNSYKYIEYYLLLTNDLYHVLIKFDKKNIQVLIEEVSALENNKSFKCEAFDGDSWNDIKVLEFCGRYQINMVNSKIKLTSNSSSNNISTFEPQKNKITFGRSKENKSAFGLQGNTAFGMPTFGAPIQGNNSNSSIESQGISSLFGGIPPSVNVNYMEVNVNYTKLKIYV